MSELIVVVAIEVRMRKCEDMLLLSRRKSTQQDCELRVINDCEVGSRGDAIRIADARDPEML